jgi:hypothetical protein
MIVSLHRHGGFAAIPGLEVRARLDTATLSPEVASALHHAVRRAEVGAKGPPGGGDRRHYDLTVEDAEGTRSFTLTDPLAGPARELIELLLSSEA